MATFVLAQIDIAISMFNSVIQYGANTPRYHGNLQWLLKLRSRASSKISAASTAKKADSNQNADADQRTGSEDEEDVELIGWRTRLIERAGQNRQKSRTIRLPATPTGSHTTNVSNVQPNESEQMMANTSLPPVTFDSTDDMVRRTSTLLMTELTSFSYMTFGIQCFCRTYLELLTIRNM